MFPKYQSYARTSSLDFRDVTLNGSSMAEWPIYRRGGKCQKKEMRKGVMDPGVGHA